MKADLIIKNAKIYTVDDRQPWAEAAAIKDGKFIYVGSDKGADDFEGPVTDLDGKFVMPGIVESHTHPGIAGNSLITEQMEMINEDTKPAVLAFLKDYIAKNPDKTSYNFFLRQEALHGERLKRDELDEICDDKPIHIVEMEIHSSWVNTFQLNKMGIDEYAPDIAPGLSYFERDDDGRVNGRMFEFCQVPIVEPLVPVEIYKQSLTYLMDYWKHVGIIAAFDAGIAMSNANVEQFLTACAEMEKEGMPIYLQSSLMLFKPDMLKDAIERLEYLDKKYSKNDFKMNVMKLMMDGTLIGRTAAVFEPYEGTDTNGGVTVELEPLTEFIIALNDHGIDFHVHTSGERAVATVLDAVEAAKAKIEEDLKIQVTLAHVQCMPDGLIGRFKELGVIANFTPHWHGSNCISYDAFKAILGPKRINQTYRANSVWNTGATVCFSSDHVEFSNMKPWNPYMGMEVGITRQDNNRDASIEDDFSQCPVHPCRAERLTMAQMIKGFTLNGAKQMRLDDKIGSIETGKDASFLVFENNLFEIDQYQIHRQLPEQVFIKGELQ